MNKLGFNCTVEGKKGSSQIKGPVPTLIWILNIQFCNDSQLFYGKYNFSMTYQHSLLGG